MFEVFEDQHSSGQDTFDVNQASEPKIEPLYEDAGEELRKQLEIAHKKLVLTEPLSQQTKQKFQESLASLAALKEEILRKLDEALLRSSLIKQKVDLLLHSGKVQVNEEEYKNSEISVQHYAQLLHTIVDDIEQEMKAFSVLTADQLPQYFIITKDEPSKFVDFVEEKIKAIRKYSKNIRKDLNVSDSRYRYGFDAQMKRISYIERFVAAQEREKTEA